MNNKVRLFIGGQEVEFSSDPSIRYNFNLDDVNNPTSVKNSFTKTVAIEGTKTNNEIFSNIWQLGQVQPSGAMVFDRYFNPSKRAEFQLFLDGDIYETGYVKLDTITRSGAKIVYNVTLYGGVGDFFYSLSYNDNGDELKLRDLHYTNGDPTTELDFNINKDTVQEAWSRLSGEDTEHNALWDVINFAPCYNGYPSNLSADKVLINYNSAFTPSLRVKSGDTTTDRTGFPTSISGGYGLYNGYALGEINGEMTEWDIRDLRSYLQRPVIRMKAIVNACCDPTQNGGYEVELDPDFFNENNIYWERAYMTLPLLNDMNIETTQQEWRGKRNYKFTVNGNYNTFYRYQDLTPRGVGASSLSVTFRPCLEVRLSEYPRPFATADTLYTSAFVDVPENPRIDYAGYVYQLYGKNTKGEIVAGSDVYHLTSSVQGKSLNLNNTAFIPQYKNASVYNRIGAFHKVDGEEGLYEWGEDITLRMETNSEYISEIWVECIAVANLEDVYSTFNRKNPEYIGQSYGYRRLKLYGSTYISGATDYSANTYSASFDTESMNNLNGVVEYSLDSDINSNSKIDKKSLLNLDGTPCDYLINYCKNFGLYFEKDPIRKKINIKTRSNFYNYPEIENWQDRIDWSKEVKITPLTFDSKWYSFNYNNDGDKSQFGDKYYNKWGTEYGIQKINTGYNFDSETKDLLDGTVFNNAIEAVEKSAYFKYRFGTNGVEIPPMCYNWFTYNLFNGDRETNGVMLGSSMQYINVPYAGYGNEYDFMPHLQFRDIEKETLDGSGVLCFYNGMKLASTTDDTVVPFWLTDDVNEMAVVNDGPCWLWTNKPTNAANQIIAIERETIPQFGRMNIVNNTIVNTWDFGKTKELYVPNALYQSDSNLYDRYWKSYVEDLYDVNARVCEANVLLPKEAGMSLLKRFYWFEDSLWRINKIKDWNICGLDPTKVEFIKVQDTTNYTYMVEPVEPIEEPMEINVTIDPFYVPASGGTITVTVISNAAANPGDGYIGCDDEETHQWVRPLTEDWDYPKNTFYLFEIEVEPNTNPSGRKFWISYVDNDDNWHTAYFGQSGTDEGILVANVEFPGNEFIDFDNIGGTKVVTLTYAGEDTVTGITATYDTSWLSIETFNISRNVFKAYVTAEPNNGVSRSYQILFTANNVTCSIPTYQEEGADPSIEVSPNPVYFYYPTERTQTLTVRSNTEWEIVNAPDWINYEITYISRTESELQLTSINDFATGATGVVEISYGDGEIYEIEVEDVDTSISVTWSVNIVPASGGTVTGTVHTNGYEWNVTTTIINGEFEKRTGVGDDYFVYSFGANTGRRIRAAMFTVDNGYIKVTSLIRQAAGA